MSKPVSLDVNVCEDAQVKIEIEEMWKYEDGKRVPNGKYMVKIDLSKFDEKKFWDFDITFPSGASVELGDDSLSYQNKFIHFYQEFGSVK